jgi:hypothetical protein
VNLPENCGPTIDLFNQFNSFNRFQLVKKSSRVICLFWGKGQALGFVLLDLYCFKITRLLGCLLRWRVSFRGIYLAPEAVVLDEVCRRAGVILTRNAVATDNQVVSNGFARIGF